MHMSNSCIDGFTWIHMDFWLKYKYLFVILPVVSIARVIGAFPFLCCLINSRFYNKYVINNK